MPFRVLIIGGTGQVGAAVVRALVAEPSCAEVVMVNRKAIPLDRESSLAAGDPGYGSCAVSRRSDQGCPEHGGAGRPVYGASCVGVGKGSRKWSEEELKALEIGVVGGFARGCHAEVLLGLRCSRQWEAQPKEDSLCASYGVKRRNGSRYRLPEAGDFPPGNYRR